MHPKDQLVVDHNIKEKYPTYLMLLIGGILVAYYLFTLLCFSQAGVWEVYKATEL